MPIDLTKEVKLDHREALTRVKEQLKANKWGVLGDIDVRAVLKEKLGVDIEDYNILDVCNPILANQSLKISKTVGLVFPCKMAVYGEDGKTKVGLYLPTKQLPSELSGNSELKKLSEQAEASLKQIFECI